MANNFKYIKTVSDSIKIKGEVMPDGKSIRYDKNGEERIVYIDNIFKNFAGEIINFSVSTKDEVDLSEEE